MHLLQNGQRSTSVQLNNAVKCINGLEAPHILSGLWAPCDVVHLGGIVPLVWAGRHLYPVPTLRSLDILLHAFRWEERGPKVKQYGNIKTFYLGEATPDQFSTVHPSF